ncbi:MAG TPA: hypothetical protein VFK41_09480 [Nocardioidaceae bacterium]|nr:hypothetical protein [Nocardioidaceae bacterium]
MSHQPYEPSPAETTQELRNQQPPPQPPPQQGWAPQGAYAPQQPYAPRGGSRPHLHVRSTFLTTEFWVFVVVSLAILIAAAVDDGPGELGFSAQDAWRYISWLAIAYMLSRGLTKLSGAPRDGGSSGTEM